MPKPNIIDNMGKAANVRHCKNNGLYIVGLTCSLRERVARRTNDRKGIDPADPSAIEQQILRTDAFMEVGRALRLAHVRYATDERDITPSRMVEEIAHVMR